MDLLGMPVADPGSFYQQLNKDISVLRNQVDQKLRDMMVAGQSDLDVLNTALRDLQIDETLADKIIQKYPSSNRSLKTSLLSHSREHRGGNGGYDDELNAADSNITERATNLSKDRSTKRSMPSSSEVQIIGIVKNEPLIEGDDEDGDETREETFKRPSILGSLSESSRDSSRALNDRQGVSSHKVMNSHNTRKEETPSSEPHIISLEDEPEDMEKTVDLISLEDYENTGTYVQHRVPLGEVDSQRKADDGSITTASDESRSGVVSRGVSSTQATRKPTVKTDKLRPYLDDGKVPTGSQDLSPSIDMVASGQEELPRSRSLYNSSSSSSSSSDSGEVATGKNEGGLLNHLKISTSEDAPEERKKREPTPRMTERSHPWQNHDFSQDFGDDDSSSSGSEEEDNVTRARKDPEARAGKSSVEAAAELNRERTSKKPEKKDIDPKDHKERIGNLLSAANQWDQDSSSKEPPAKSPRRFPSLELSPRESVNAAAEQEDVAKEDGYTQEENYSPRESEEQIFPESLSLLDVAALSADSASSRKKVPAEKSGESEAAENPKRPPTPEIGSSTRKAWSTTDSTLKSERHPSEDQKTKEQDVQERDGAGRPSPESPRRIRGAVKSARPQKSNAEKDGSSFLEGSATYGNRGARRGSLRKDREQEGMGLSKSQSMGSKSRSHTITNSRSMNSSAIDSKDRVQASQSMDSGLQDRRDETKRATSRRRESPATSRGRIPDKNEKQDHEIRRQNRERRAERQRALGIDPERISSRRRSTTKGSDDAVRQKERVDQPPVQELVFDKHEDSDGTDDLDMDGASHHRERMRKKSEQRTRSSKRAGRESPRKERSREAEGGALALYEGKGVKYEFVLPPDVSIPGSFRSQSPIVQATIPRELLQSPPEQQQKRAQRKTRHQSSGGNEKQLTLYQEDHKDTRSSKQRAIVPKRGSQSQSSPSTLEDHQLVLLQQVQNKTITDPYGDEGRYTGVMVGGKPHGQGTMHYKDGRLYSGDWRQGRWHGHGHAVFANKDSYVGQYSNDQRHGHGRYEWCDGRVYDGGFEMDHRQGQGTYTWPDGAVYTGGFHKGLRHGTGRYIFSDGSVYSGDWQSGKYDGQGECIWADGRRYRGQWKNGQAQGYGVEHRPDGTIRHEGEWKKDRPVRPKRET
eukprot:CAMPEP_0172451928 /NCGR_PEP_ID=MMETSP1065-20121228/9745_1 /TAXON_ID=265537 /ORGANISM="Amphiprora paludosa, Strain CCMP125" /LENGTH=1150 /DNA_ID=CAMNT_0013203899 /DNA_START=138 /DNA_END=3590 /DNA_ORIENTATION=+